MKKKALKVYFFFINSWTDGVKSSRKTLLPVLANRRARAKGVYAIDLDSDWIGLGARMVKTLYEEVGKAPSPAAPSPGGVLATQMPSTCFSPSASMPTAR